MLVIDTRIKLLLFILINFMVFGLKDFILGSVCFFFICILSCLMGQKKIVLKYLIFYVVIAAIQQLCAFLPQAIETILSIFTLFIRVMIPVVLFASTFIATTKVSELIAAMYSLKIPRSITITFAMVLRFFPTFSEEIHNIYDAMKLRGIALVLTGESGCGKTCVTRLINTLIPHFYEGEMSGAVLIDGVDTRTIQPHDLSDKIGSVFQNPRSQFFSLDTDSEIVFGMENKGMPYQVMLNRYQQTIRELHIEKLKDRNLFDLSGGQKQTIAFASVYALNPDIFVLDEPSSNLDPEAIQELRRLLLLIKAQGKTIVVSEHRLYFLNGIADRIVLMEHGKLKQSWSARDFALLSTEQIKALGLRSYTPARLELPETMPSRNDTPAVEVKDLAIG